jgi:aryl-alcohol dehydrogenase-like predicted oxidoreductase
MAFKLKAKPSRLRRRTDRLQEGLPMSAPNASASGQFILGDITINRLGFGAMRLTGKGIWGEPADRSACLATLRRLPELGVNFIDTADSYGPATKGGLTRPGPDIWAPLGRPEYLRECVLMSLRRLKIERIDLWQLHRIDPKVPRDEQFAAIRDMQKEGLIRHVGLSEVGVEDIGAAQEFFHVASVQNRYNLVDRASEDVLEHCAKAGIGFIPWFPLAAGELAKPGSILDSIAKRKGATPSQIALAWVLKRSPVMLPIPGTSSVKHLEENVAATGIVLSGDEFQTLDEHGKAAAK